MSKTSLGDSRLAPLIARTWHSPTLEQHKLFKRMKEEGRDVVSLAVGESDFPTPPNVREAAKKAIDEGKTRYTPVDGSLEARLAVSRKLFRENNLSYDPHREIIITAGGKQAIHNALLATVCLGDEIIIPKPYWYSYHQLADVLGARAVFVEGDLHREYKTTAEQLEGAITSKTKWFILNSPSNPTSAVYSRSELQEIAAVLMRHPHVLVLSDDVYEYLVLEGEPFANILNVEPRLRERTVVVNGASKAFAMAGWRIGFGAGPSWLIEAMVALQRGQTLNPSSVSQSAMIEAFNGHRDFVEEYRRMYRTRRDIAVEALLQMPGLLCNRPRAAFYVYVDASELMGTFSPAGRRIESDVDLGMVLLEEFGVNIAPGKSFGSTPHSPHIRICYAVQKVAELREALSRTDRGCRALAASKIQKATGP